MVAVDCEGSDEGLSAMCSAATGQVDARLELDALARAAGFCRAMTPSNHRARISHFTADSQSTMSATKSKSKSKSAPPTTQEIQQNYNRLQNDLQTLASKIGELEQEAEEHGLVLSTLDEALAEEPDRKCFRLVGGVLVERTV